MNDSRVLSVSRLVELLREVVEDNFLDVAVEGEISNFAAPGSGHFYFTLKDSRCQVRAVMFRQYNRLLNFKPENGQQVICRGRMTVYPQRGELQMAVEHLEIKGAGGLQAAFEALKADLEKQGLFSAERKRPLPSYPQTVGVITSGTGAAIRDILNVLSRRAAGGRVVGCPVRVQGDGAVKEIVDAIELMNRLDAADVLIVGRGGGSLEDLWAFNEEEVARAIFASGIPVISAVGHEVDVTIADYVADYRAPTPSAAAEVVARSCEEIEMQIDHLTQRMFQVQAAALSRSQERVSSLCRRLRSPYQVVIDKMNYQKGLQRRLQLAMRVGLERKQSAFDHAEGRLEAFSPQRTLERGYSIVTLSDGKTVVRQAALTSQGDKLKVRFCEGSADVSVERVNR